MKIHSPTGCRPLFWGYWHNNAPIPTKSVFPIIVAYRSLSEYWQILPNSTFPISYGLLFDHSGVIVVIVVGVCHKHTPWQSQCSRCQNFFKGKFPSVYQNQIEKEFYDFLYNPNSAAKEDSQQFFNVWFYHVITLKKNTLLAKAGQTKQLASKYPNYRPFLRQEVPK